MAAELDGARCSIESLEKVPLGARRRSRFNQPHPEADTRGVALLARRLAKLILIRSCFAVRRRDRAGSAKCSTWAGRACTLGEGRGGGAKLPGRASNRCCAAFGAVVALPTCSCAGRRDLGCEFRRVTNVARHAWLRQAFDGALCGQLQKSCRAVAAQPALFRARALNTRRDKPSERCRHLIAHNTLNVELALDPRLS